MCDHKLIVLAAFLSLLGCAQVACAEESVVTSHTSEINSASAERSNGSIEFGLGLSLEPLPDEFSLGWDLLLGYEWRKSENWNVGLQLHYQQSLFDKPHFDTVGIYATARPENRWFSWLQFRAGPISDHYSSTAMVPYTTPPYYLHEAPVSWDGTGFALGTGIVWNSSGWQLHLLDMERHYVAGRSFTLYTMCAFVVSI